jgi:hypothetical protein
MQRAPLGGIDDLAKAREMNARDHEIASKR